VIDLILATGKSCALNPPLLENCWGGSELGFIGVAPYPDNDPSARHADMKQHFVIVSRFTNTFTTGGVQEADTPAETAR
jgi:hypothetical protein